MQNDRENTSSLVFPVASYKAIDLAWTFGLMIAAVIFPAILAHAPQNQWITGTIVNMIIFLAVWRVGIVNAAFVAALPSSIALMRGLLPAPMAVMIPWIIISNFVLILAFFYAKKYPIAGIVFSSTAKFLFLFIVTSYFVKIASPFLFMLQWPQLFTALAGGLIAVGIIRFSLEIKNRLSRLA